MRREASARGPLGGSRGWRGRRPHHWSQSFSHRPYRTDRIGLLIGHLHIFSKLTAILASNQEVSFFSFERVPLKSAGGQDVDTPQAHVSVYSKLYDRHPYPPRTPMRLNY